MVAHESAHKWLGRTAGMQLVGSSWVLEGLAEYLGYRALEAILPTQSIQKLFRERTYTPFVEASRGRTRSLSSIEVFDEDGQWLFQKGALLFRMLHRRLGDPLFDAVLRRFLESYQKDHASASDFTRFVSQTASSIADELGIERPGTSSADLTDFFRAWAEGRQTLDYSLRVQVDEAIDGGYDLRLTVESLGRLTEPGPVDVAVWTDSGRRIDLSLQLGEVHAVYVEEEPISAQLDPDLWLADVNPTNNLWEKEDS